MSVYKNIQALDRDKHSNFKVHDPGFGFTRDQQTAPLTGVEFARASLTYPIVFVGESPADLFPVALFSLHQKHNAHVDSLGQWTSGYIPAFFRRYPYILSDNDKVCIDVEADAFIEDGEPLFKDGENTKILDDAISFLAQYQAAVKQTRDFCSILLELKLTRPWSLQFIRENKSSFSIDGFSIIDEKKLSELDDQQIVDFYRSGTLDWITSHRNSLSHFETLGDPIKSSTEY